MCSCAPAGADVAGAAAKPEQVGVCAFKLGDLVASCARAAAPPRDGGCARPPAEHASAALEPFLSVARGMCENSARAVCGIDAARQRWDHSQPFMKETRCSPGIAWMHAYLEQAVSDTHAALAALPPDGRSAASTPAAAACLLAAVDAVVTTQAALYAAHIVPSRARSLQFGVNALCLVAAGLVRVRQAEALAAAATPVSSGAPSSAAAVEAAAAACRSICAAYADNVRSCLGHLVTIAALLVCPASVLGEALRQLTAGTVVPLDGADSVPTAHPATAWSAPGAPSAAAPAAAGVSVARALSFAAADGGGDAAAGIAAVDVGSGDSDSVGGGTDATAFEGMQAVALRVAEAAEAAFGIGGSRAAATAAASPSTSSTASPTTAASGCRIVECLDVWADCTADTPSLAAVADTGSSAAGASALAPVAAAGAAASRTCVSLFSALRAGIDKPLPLKPPDGAGVEGMAAATASPWWRLLVAQPATFATAARPGLATGCSVFNLTREELATWLPRRYELIGSGSRAGASSDSVWPPLSPAQSEVRSALLPLATALGVGDGVTIEAGSGGGGSGGPA